MLAQMWTPAHGASAKRTAHHGSRYLFSVKLMLRFTTCVQHRAMPEHGRESISVNAADLQVLLGELVATRRQVDRLLSQHDLLLAMLARHPAFAEVRLPVSAAIMDGTEQAAAEPVDASPPATPQSGVAGSSHREPNDEDWASGSNPVTELLVELKGPARGSEDTAGSSILEAIRQLETQDVLLGDVAAAAHNDAPVASVPQASDPPAESQIVAQGAPPPLSLGSDDIRWVSWLHRALMANGFYPSEEECEDWLFGDGTLEALLTAQASAGLPETGVACIKTWQLLLQGPQGDEVRQEVEAAVGDALQSWDASSDSGVGSSGAAASSDMHPSVHGRPATAAPEARTAPRDSAVPPAWPAIMDGDGGRTVGVMQAALQAAGFYCGEDDTLWWQCGDDTVNALRTFQACHGLAETGVCDAATWTALAKAVGNGASSVDQLQDALRERREWEGEDGEEAWQEEDLTEGQQAGRVWLLGEQRWERRA